MSYAARRHTDNKKMNRQMIDWQNWLNGNVFLFIRLQLLFVTFENTKRWVKTFNGKSHINCFRIQKGSSVTNFWSVTNVLVCVCGFSICIPLFLTIMSLIFRSQQKLFQFPAAAILCRPYTIPSDRTTLASVSSQQWRWDQICQWRCFVCANSIFTTFSIINSLLSTLKHIEINKLGINHLA